MQMRFVILSLLNEYMMTMERCRVQRCDGKTGALYNVQIAAAAQVGCIAYNYKRIDKHGTAGGGDRSVQLRSVVN